MVSKRFLVWASASALVVGLSACGGGGGGGGTSPAEGAAMGATAAAAANNSGAAAGNVESLTGGVQLSGLVGAAPPTTIPSTAPARQAAGQINNDYARAFDAQRGAVQKASAQVHRAVKQARSSKVGVQSHSVVDPLDLGCVSGTATLTTNYNASEEISSIVWQATNCDDGFGSITNGSMTFAITAVSVVDTTTYSYDFTGSMTMSNFSIQIYDTGPSDVVLTLTSNMTMSLTESGDWVPNISGGYDATVTGSYTANGTTTLAANFDDGQGGTVTIDASFDYNNVVASSTVNLNTDSLDNVLLFTMSDSINGGFSFDGFATNGTQSATFAESVSYSSFTTNIDVTNVFGGTFSDIAEITISGSFTASYSDPDGCFEGTFTVSTPSPLQYDATFERFVGGTLKVNNVTLTFNSDGSVLVTTPSGSTTMSSFQFSSSEDDCAVIAGI